MILKKFSPIFLIILTTSCSHLTPVVNDYETPSFDGNDQNSGIIGIIKTTGPDGEDVFQGYEITPRARDRYNQYIDGYGKRIITPIEKDFGVTPMLNGHFLMTKEAALDWREMILIKDKDKIDEQGTLLNKIGVSN